MYNPQDDTYKLRNYIKSKDKKGLTKFVGSLSSSKRYQIVPLYKSSYGRDLYEDLKNLLTGCLEDTMIALFQTPEDYDCESLRKAMKGFGTDEDTLIEIIATRPNYMIKAINKRYTEIFKGRILMKDIEDETSGTFRKLLLNLLQGNRSENLNPDLKKCENDAKGLNEDDLYFNTIFALRSPMEIVEIIRLFHKISGKTILEYINIS